MKEKPVETPLANHPNSSVTVIPDQTAILRFPHVPNGSLRVGANDRNGVRSWLQWVDSGHSTRLWQLAREGFVRGWRRITRSARRQHFPKSLLCQEISHHIGHHFAAS